MKRVSQLIVMAIGIVAAAVASPQSQGADPAVKSAILFIGDGMGVAHITAARIYSGGCDGRLAMESLPFTGFCRTHSSSDYVTDSAAAGTALASGVKTHNGVLGLSDLTIDPTGEMRPLQKITDLLLAAGKSVGVITTTDITNATPAAFYANVVDRWEMAEIANQIDGSGLTLLMGGGRAMFHPSSWQDPENGLSGQSIDERDLQGELTTGGWTFVNSRQELAQVDPAQEGLKLIATFQYSHMNYELDRPNDVLGEPSLAEMTQFAIDVLSRDPDGYFLMVEGGLIDQASHTNDARHAIEEVLAMDQAIVVGLDAIDSETLLVVTADHETGGLALNGYAPRRGMLGQTLLGNILDEAGLRGLISWASGPGGSSPEAVDESNPHFQHRAAYPRSIATHSAVDVPLMAIGPGASVFSGYHDNTEIPLLITQLMGLVFDSEVNQANREAYDAQKTSARDWTYQ